MRKVKGPSERYENLNDVVIMTFKRLLGARKRAGIS